MIKRVISLTLTPVLSFICPHMFFTECSQIRAPLFCFCGKITQCLCNLCCHRPELSHRKLLIMIRQWNDVLVITHNFTLCIVFDNKALLFMISKLSHMFTGSKIHRFYTFIYSRKYFREFKCNRDKF